MIRRLVVIFFTLLCFLKIHILNDYLLDIPSIILMVVLILKRYYNILFVQAISWYMVLPIWLLLCNTLSPYMHHFTMLADILLVTLISLLIHSFLFRNTNKKNYILLFLLVLIIFLCPYMPYDKYIYWFSLIFAISLISLMFDTSDLYKSTNKYLLSAALIIVLIANLCYVYRPKINSIAVLHSKWCDVSKEVDKNSFGMDYFYAYSDFLSILNSYAKTTIITNKDIADNKLNYDAMVLITPTYSFSQKEVDNILKYTKNGGRLIIIADHTNLYGHADNHNLILNRLNAHLNDDTLYDNLNYYKNYNINIKSKFINKIYTKTNSSIRLPFYSYVWGISSNIISEKADYTKENFFGSLEFSEDDVVGSFPIGATLFLGKGQIVIWTDSTLFSNFAISQKNHLYLLDYIIKGSVINDNNRNTTYKKLNIIADNETLKEAPPGFIPKGNQYSTLIANQTRYNILPVYNGFNNTQQLHIIKYNDFVTNIKEIDNKKHYIIIDDIPENNIFGAKKFDIHTKQILKECKDNCFYSTNGIYVTTQYKTANILFGKNVISDQELGTWWNTLPISPYKQYIIKAFNNWIEENKNITFFDYPLVKNKQLEAIRIFDDGKKETLNNVSISNPIQVNDYKFVYLGKRTWGILLNNGTILGGMETTDNISEPNKLNKWTINFNRREK